MNRRDPIVFATTAVLAFGVPIGAATYVHTKTAQLADHLGIAAGVTTKIGHVDADLTACIRLSDVRLGELFSADSIEASVALDSLLSGQFGADEIRVANPHVAVEVDRGGDSDLARVVRRLAKSGSAQHGGPRLRRIVVSSGTLAAHIKGVGEVTADGVELVPDAGGVRVTTGALHIKGSFGHGDHELHGELSLARSSAEVALPHVKFGRVLAVAGAGTIESTTTRGTTKIPLRDVSIGRLVAGGSLELRAALDDGGMPRHIAVEVAPPTPDGELTVTLRGEKLPLRAFAALAPHGVILDDAHASGWISILRDGATTSLVVDGTLEGARVEHHLVGMSPISVAGRLRGMLSLSPDAVTADRVALDIGAAHWTANGTVKRGQPVAATLDVALQTAPCNDLLASLPPEIRGPLDGMAMTGNFGGRAHLGLDLAKPIGEGVDLELDLDNRCTVITEPPAADATTLAIASDQPFADGSHALVGKGIGMWAELRTLPGYLPAAFVSAEDGRFYEHHGFDTTQIGKSLEIDLRDKKLARGGSTISQQLVKNAFLDPAPQRSTASFRRRS